MLSGRSLAAAAAVVVSASIVAGLAAIESPSTKRRLRIDAQRVRDLYALASAVDCYFAERGSLPSELAVFDPEQGDPKVRRCAPSSMTDPETGQPYEYRAVSADGFELCAVFAEPSPASERHHPGQRLGPHRAGRQCFPLAAVPPEKS